MTQNPWLSSLVREFQIDYHEAGRNENHDALLGIVPEMQNLENLDLKSLPLSGVLEESNHRLLAMFVPKIIAEDEPHVLCAGLTLRSIHLGADSGAECVSCWRLGPNEIVFYMERLEKLCIQSAKIERLHPKAFTARMPSKKTALKELSFIDCVVSPNTIGNILAFPKCLTHFTMKARSLSPTIASDANLRPNDYIKVLKRSTSANIKYLHLDIGNTDGPLDFDGLECLTHLELPLEAIHIYLKEKNTKFTGRLLPRALEVLTLHDHRSEGLALRQLLSNVQDRALPHLREIIYNTFSNNNKGKESQNDLEVDTRDLQKLGVGLCIVRQQGTSF